MDEAGFIESTLSNVANREILARLPSLGLSDAWLVSGALFQTAWNRLTNRPLDYGIRDYDIFYFDADTSYEAEDNVIARANAAFAGLNRTVEVRNQARVHLWFADRFGCDYPQLRRAEESLRYYASFVQAVGVRLTADDCLDVAAPFGLDDVFAMRIRPNHALNNAASHTDKAARAKAIWPQVVIEPW